MSSHFFVPSFSKSTPNKVHNELAITSSNTVLRLAGEDWASAIATESIPATVDGEYIFVVRMDNDSNLGIMVGVSPMEIFDSNVQGYPGFNEMTGSALSLYSGTYQPGGKQNLVDAKISKKAQEVIVVVTIVNNGALKLIRWIVDGKSSPNLDCSVDCKGDKLFPVVSLGKENQQITTIPIDQVSIRSNEVKKLTELFLKQSSVSAAAVADNNNQQQPSSFAFAQLQQELEKERKRADLAESNFQQAQQLIAQLQQEIAEFKKK